ncbi:MAG: PIG-L family deacetylase [Thermodesulfovibrionales bacterium]
MDTDKILEKSILVVAHPDDEVLWFSSILERVNEVAICFVKCASNPQRELGREKSLSAYPIKRVSCLGLVEAEIFNKADWQNPVITNCGIEISFDTISGSRYRNNYYELRRQLENKLSDRLNVFTHNPWGEYGHEEHVQVYRIVKELQEKLKFNLWFSNYCSNRSSNLMMQYISGFSSEYMTLKTNKAIANRVMDIYKENNCWTWYDDWEWFNDESFMQDIKSEVGEKTYGHIFPLNMIKMNCLNRSNEQVRQRTLKSILLSASIGKVIKVLSRHREKTN